MNIQLNNVSSFDLSFWAVGSVLILGGLFATYYYKESIINLFFEDVSGSEDSSPEDTQKETNSTDSPKSTIDSLDSPRGTIDSLGSSTPKNFSDDEVFSDEGLGFYLGGSPDEINIYEEYMNSCKLDFSVFEPSSNPLPESTETSPLSPANIPLPESGISTPTFGILPEGVIGDIRDIPAYLSYDVFYDLASIFL